MAEKSLIWDYITEKFLATALLSWQSRGTGQKDDTKFLSYQFNDQIKEQL